MSATDPHPHRQVVSVAAYREALEESYERQRLIWDIRSRLARMQGAYVGIGTVPVAEITDLLNELRDGKLADR